MQFKIKNNIHLEINKFILHNEYCKRDHIKAVKVIAQLFIKQIQLNT